MKTRNKGIGTRRAAGLAALFCVVAAIYQLLIGLYNGGVPPEFVVFALLALVFGGLWYTRRS